MSITKTIIRHPNGTIITTETRMSDLMEERRLQLPLITKYKETESNETLYKVNTEKKWSPRPRKDLRVKNENINSWKKVENCVEANGGVATEKQLIECVKGHKDIKNGAVVFGEKTDRRHIKWLRDKKRIVIA